MKKLLWLLLGLFAIFSAACGFPTQEEEVPPSPLGKKIEKLTISKGTKVMSLRRDYRKCPSPFCGGYWVKTIQHSYMRCADGRWAKECYVSGVDWGALNLLRPQIQKLEKNITRVLVRGHLILRNFGHRRVGVLIAKQAWQAATNKKPTSYAFRVKKPQNSHRYYIHLINYNWKHYVDLLDLFKVGASRHQIKLAQDALKEGNLIVFGRLDWTWQHHNKPIRRWNLRLTASQFYLPVKPIECFADDDCTLTKSYTYNSQNNCYCYMPCYPSVAPKNNIPTYNVCADGICAIPACAPPIDQYAAVCQNHKCTLRKTPTSGGFRP